MESMTAVPATGGSSGSATIADLIGLAAERFADRVAVRQKTGGDENRRPPHAPSACHVRSPAGLRVTHPRPGLSPAGRPASSSGPSGAACSG